MTKTYKYQYVLINSLVVSADLLLGSLSCFHLQDAKLDTAGDTGNHNLKLHDTVLSTKVFADAARKQRQSGRDGKQVL